MGCQASRVASEAQPDGGAQAAASKRLGETASDEESGRRASMATSVGAGVEVSVQMAAAMEEGGIAGVLKLMKANPSDAEFQWWGADAIAGLCAGNESNRAELFVHHGIVTVLTAMKQHKWNPTVQFKSFYAIANLAATYADYLGKHGAVEAVVEGMAACEDDYQVQQAGMRCLENLVLASEGNLARARKVGAQALIENTLSSHPDDGQMQWRGMTVLKSMQSMRRMSVLDRLPPPARTTEVSTVDAVAPGHHGKSKRAARAARKGVPAVLALIKANPTDEDLNMWCIDALATLCEHDEDNRSIAFVQNAIDIIVARLNEFSWNAELCAKCLWALAAISSSHAVEVGDAGAVEAATVAVSHNETSHDTMTSAVRLFQLLLKTPSNTLRAKDAGVAAVLTCAVKHHLEDNMLKYRLDRVLDMLGEETLFSPTSASCPPSARERHVVPDAPGAVVVAAAAATEAGAAAEVVRVTSTTEAAAAPGAEGNTAEVAVVATSTHVVTTTTETVTTAITSGAHADDAVISELDNVSELFSQSGLMQDTATTPPAAQEAGQK